MKYFLILISIFSPILNASGPVKWETDYYPNFGRVSITWIDQNTVVMEEDRNNCVFDNFGFLSACTLMAPITTLDNIKLLLQDEYSNLYEFENIKHLRMVTNSGVRKLLKIDEQTGNVIFALRLHPRLISLPEYLKIKKLNF